MSKKEFRSRNAEGLFVPMRVTAVISEATFQKLKEIALPKLRETHPPGSKIETQAVAVIEALESMRLEKDAWINSANPCDSFGSSYKFGTAPGRVWAAPQRAVGDPARWSVEHSFANAKEAGWEAIETLRKNSKAAWELFSKLGAGYGWADRNALSGAAALAKKTPTITFEPIANTAASNVDFFVVMVEGGFADKDGFASTIACARSFESAAAAKRWCSAKGFGKWKVLRAKANLEEALDLPGDSWMDSVGDAISQSEKMQLERALEKASVEALKKKLAQLESSARQEPETPVEVKASRSRL